jgi:hypothetical protein
MRLPDGSGGSTFQWGTADYTLDGWFYVVDLTSPSFPGWWAKRNGNSDTASSWYMWMGTSGSPLCSGRHNWTTGGSLSEAWTPTLNQWMHVAMTVKDLIMYLFYDGVLMASGSVASATGGVSRDVVVGAPYYQSGTGYMNGWVDEFRAMKGAARWTESFVPPTAPSDFAEAA